VLAKFLIFSSFYNVVISQEDEEEEVPLIRKRKKTSSSISQKGDEENDDHQAKEAKKKKKFEEKEVKGKLREKKVIKKSKVPRALRIHTSTDSEESPKPKEVPAQEEEAVVEKDQHMNVEDNLQSGDPTFTPNAPSAQAKDFPLIDPEVEGKKVYPIRFSSFISLLTFYCFKLTYLYAYRMNQKMTPL
jgi:hypothetical protein